VIDAGLAVFCVAMMVLMHVEDERVTVPYHLLFLSLTIVYGFRVWPLLPTTVVLTGVTLVTGLILVEHYRGGRMDAAELFEIPLMPALVVAMVWHARRRVAAQRAVQRMSDHQRDMLDRERSFFRNTSHAIRTPVTIARGHLELADREIVVPQAREDVQVALRQLERMGLLSNRLLALAQLEAGDAPPALPLRLRAFVLEVGHNWAAEPGRRWTVECPEDAVFFADPAWMGLAVDALIENAVHFTSDGGRIEIRGLVRGERCVISVSDDGPGIAAGDVDHVFEQFWHRQPPNGPMGSGLGLPMARATARASGGEARARTSAHGGATIELDLPCRRLRSRAPLV
jgi:signal transduction histidine kinase